MKCCPNCFGDRGLRKSIIPSLSPMRGTCDYCRSSDVDLIEPQALGDYFALLTNIYVAESSGRLLVEWLKDDWRLFDHPNLDAHGAKSLLGDILDDGEIVRQMFVPSPDFVSAELDHWESLRSELMYENRYFPNARVDTGRLEQLLAHLPADDMPTTWYRARIKTGDALYPIGEMGAPPKRLASHGRANPPGIPYLYLGSSAQTAASEIRPHTGEIACVADFTLPADLSAVDLRNPRQLVSPFLLADEDDIGQMRIDIAFLERLGEELTRPVQPQAAAIDYVPSQYLCEFIKKCGYHGVVYRSSVSDGINLALFDPAMAVAGKVLEYEISRVLVDVEPVPPRVRPGRAIQLDPEE
jgi:hypothetical protein